MVSVLQTLKPDSCKRLLDLSFLPQLPVLLRAQAYAKLAFCSKSSFSGLKFRKTQNLCLNQTTLPSLQRVQKLCFERGLEVKRADFYYFAWRQRDRAVLLLFVHDQVLGGGYVAEGREELSGRVDALNTGLPQYVPVENRLEFLFRKTFLFMKRK